MCVKVKGGLGLYTYKREEEEIYLMTIGTGLPGFQIFVAARPINSEHPCCPVFSERYLRVVSCFLEQEDGIKFKKFLLFSLCSSSSLAQVLCSSPVHCVVCWTIIVDVFHTLGSTLHVVLCVRLASLVTC